MSPRDTYQKQKWLHEALNKKQTLNEKLSFLTECTLITSDQWFMDYCEHLRDKIVVAENAYHAGIKNAKIHTVVILDS